MAGRRLNLPVTRKHPSRSRWPRYDNLVTTYTSPTLSLVDNHTALGETDLPKTIQSLCELAIKDSPTPPDSRVVPVFELSRVAANLCVDHGNLMFSVPSALC